jgi:hypothetical protein
MWKPHTFSQDKIWNIHMNDRNDIKLDPGFQFIVYSKYVIQRNLYGEILFDNIVKRFDKSFPLNSTNIIILTK